MKIAAKTLLVAVLLGTAAASATAEGFYGAVDLGSTHGLDVCTNPGATGCASTATAFRIAGGYQFAPQWAGELSYGSYGSASLGAGNGDWKTDGFQLSLVGKLPISNEFSVIAKVGLANTNLTVTAPGAPTMSASRLNLSSGIGAQFDVNKSVALRAQYENLGLAGDPITTGTTRLSLLSAGIIAKF